MGAGSFFFSGTRRKIGYFVYEITYFSTLNTECGTVFDMINFCFWRMVWKIFWGFGRMVCRYEIWIGEMWDEVCTCCGSAYWEKGA